MAKPLKLHKAVWFHQLPAKVRKLIPTVTSGMYMTYGDYDQQQFYILERYELQNQVDGNELEGDVNKKFIALIKAMCELNIDIIIYDPI